MDKSEILEDLKSKIISEKFSPGEYLIERELCAQYGVSRTPLREILFGLVDKGFVIRQNGKGFSVRQMGFKQLFEIFETREGLEGMAARLCCRKVAPADKRRLLTLKKRIEDLDAVNQSDEGVRLGRALHQLIIEVAGNTLMADFYEKLNNLTALTSNMTKKFVNIEVESRLFHIRIIDAILAGDEEKSERQMRDHISLTCSHLLKSLFPGYGSVLEKVSMGP
jgi:DNA-binding GntR family transcriptional regulator